MYMNLMVIAHQFRMAMASWLVYEHSIFVQLNILKGCMYDKYFVRFFLVSFHLIGFARCYDIGR